MVRRRTFLAITACLIAGAALGVAIGWWLWPVEYVNTTPDTLRRDYQDDYIVMVATAYEVESNLDRARERLRLLNPAEPEAPLAELVERLVAAGGSPTDLTRLKRLLDALRTASPPPTPAPLK